MTGLKALLLNQRIAFAIELPVSTSIRKDRLKRLIVLLKDNAEAFATALSAIAVASRAC